MMIRKNSVMVGKIILLFVLSANFVIASGNSLLIQANEFENRIPTGNIVYSSVTGSANALPYERSTEITRVEWSYKNQITIISSRQIDSITLPRNFSYLKIDFPVSLYDNEQDVNYRYLLNSRNKTADWIELGTKSYVIFSRLNSGLNTLLISASIQGQGDISNPAELRIYVTQHFWYSPYAIVLYVLIFIILFFAFFRIQTRALRNLTRQFREREKIAQQILTQKEELSLKNKNITDSINYAKRIQSALMPSEKQFMNIFPESFVLHIPRDIVSGDFYWINEIKENIFIAAVDCTGHGVP